MKAKSVLSDEVHRELAAIAESVGCELLQVEFQGATLQVVLDREGGVRLEDCEAVAKRSSALLDVLEFGRGRYTLEVTSPGLDRKLYGPRDYARFVGSLVRVRFRDPDQAGKPVTWIGRLSAFDASAAGGGEVEVVERDRGATRRIRLSDIEKTRLEIEL